MNKSESIAKLAEALSKAQGAIKGAIRDSQNPFFRSKYADLASVWDACRKELSENGLSVVQIPETADGLISIKTVLMHSSGEYVSGDLAMKPVKDDPQGVGSCITYARRYALSAFVGIAPEDDDGNAASGNVGTKAQNVKRIEEDIPLIKGAVVIPPAEDRITPEQAGKWAKRFREALPDAMQPQADAILSDWLGSKLYLDDTGNPSKLAVRKDEYERVGKESIAFAKELAA